MKLFRTLARICCLLSVFLLFALGSARADYGINTPPSGSRTIISSVNNWFYLETPQTFAIGDTIDIAMFCDNVLSRPYLTLAEERPLFDVRYSISLLGNAASGYQLTGRIYENAPPVGQPAGFSERVIQIAAANGLPIRLDLVPSSVVAYNNRTVVNPGVPLLSPEADIINGNGLRVGQVNPGQEFVVLSKYIVRPAAVVVVPEPSTLTLLPIALAFGLCITRGRFKK